MSDIITREDLKDWMEQNGCELEVMAGLNMTGHQIKVVNKNLPHHYVYLDLPIDGRPVPHFAVCDICDQLNILYPDCVESQKNLVDHLKTKYANKRRL